MKKLLVVFALVLGACGVDEDGAREWVNSNFPDARSFDCVSIDSDDDGYVSCTVFFDGQRDPLAIECAAAFTPLKDGCRLATGKSVLKK